MKVLVIPDVHLKSWMFDRADDILKARKAEKTICLMDIPDDWGMELQVEKYRIVFDRAIQFAKEHPDTLWCYGNHDVSYPWGKLESGYSPYAERTVITKLEELERVIPDSGIAIIHRIDNIVFSHGGLSVEFVRRLGASLTDADIDSVIGAVNDAPIEHLWDDDTPLWLRPQYNNYEIFRNDVYTQVVGHTPVETIFEKDGVISTDVFSTYSNGQQIGEPAMIVIDTETGSYDKISV